MRSGNVLKHCPFLSSPSWSWSGAQVMMWCHLLQSAWCVTTSQCTINRFESTNTLLHCVIGTLLTKCNTSTLLNFHSIANTLHAVTSYKNFHLELQKCDTSSQQNHRASTLHIAQSTSHIAHCRHTTNNLWPPGPVSVCFWGFILENRSWCLFFSF